MKRSKVKVAVDTYPYNDPVTGDRSGWLYELARARILVALIVEKDLSCEITGALSVSSLREAKAQDEPIIWIVSDPEFHDNKELPGGSWRYRKVLGFATGNILQWQQGKNKVKGFEIEAICSGQSEINNILLDAIEREAQNQNIHDIVAKIANPLPVVFLRAQGFKTDPKDDKWIQKKM